MNPQEPPLRYVFSMDQWTPKTIPAKRLAQYIDKLSVLFGSHAAVHFEKITKGSARPAFRIDAHAAEDVRKRLKAANDDDDAESAASKKEVNKMLRDDGCTGFLQADPGPKVIVFPGRKTSISEEVVVHESGALEGTVIKLGGRDDTVPLSIETGDGIYYKCTVTRLMAKQLAQYLFDGEVRLFGNGKWQRGQDGVWRLLSFDVKNFERLGSDTLTDFVKDMRAVEGSEWNAADDPQVLLRQIRED